MGEWKSLRKAFWELEYADEDFLRGFEMAPHKLDSDLRIIDGLLRNRKREDAWKRFMALRSDIRKDVESLPDVVETLGKAEDHIRRVLT